MLLVVTSWPPLCNGLLGMSNFVHCLLCALARYYDYESPESVVTVP